MNSTCIRDGRSNSRRCVSMLSRRTGSREARRTAGEHWQDTDLVFTTQLGMLQEPDGPITINVTAVAVP